MFDERSPIMRRAMAPYENTMAEYVAELAGRGAEFRERLAKLTAEADERDRALRERIAAMDIETLLARYQGPDAPGCLPDDEEDFSTVDWLDGR